MPEKKYSNSQLYSIAAENYKILKDFCTLITDEGYWNAAEKVLNMSAEEILDIYVESLLICFASYCDRLGPSEKAFISALSEAAKTLIETCTSDKELVGKAEHFQKNPPIIMQLLSLRDVENDSGYASLFFDALTNIMLSLSYLNGHRQAIASKYLGIYFDRISAFLSNGKNKAQSIDNKYIFKKLCYGDLENSAEDIKKAEGDFENYKILHLYYTKEQFGAVQAAQVSDVYVERNGKKLDGKVIVENPIADNDTTSTVQDKPVSDKAEKTDVKEGTNNFDTNESFVSNEDKETEDVKPAEKLEEKPAETPAKDNTNDAKILETVHDAALKDLLDELNALVGLSNVKQEIKSLINLIKVRKMREQYKLPAIEMSYHMVFTGSPGTGKTTVARIVGQIYKELGILSKGTVTETDRSGLVAGYVGQTALKVHEVVENSLGGVLFIDEAYTLASSSGNDFGQEALDTLVKLMEDHRNDLVVIVAGYTEEMKEFLKSNTGLVSRFNRFITFPDYTDDELVDIFKNMADKNSFNMDEGVITSLKEYLATMPDRLRAEFGNARGIRNLFESMIVNQANRVIRTEVSSMEELTRFTTEDVSW